MKRILTTALVALTTSLASMAQTAYPIALDLRDSLGRESYYTSVEVPDGNYKVTVTLGARRYAGSTTVRAESRRLFIENEPTRKGEEKEIAFLVNKRTPRIDDRHEGRIKELKA